MVEETPAVVQPDLHSAKQAPEQIMDAPPPVKWTKHRQNQGDESTALLDSSTSYSDTTLQHQSDTGLFGTTPNLPRGIMVHHHESRKGGFLVEDKNGEKAREENAKLLKPNNIVYSSEEADSKANMSSFQQQQRRPTKGEYRNVMLRCTTIRNKWIAMMLLLLVSFVVIAPARAQHEKSYTALADVLHGVISQDRGVGNGASKVSTLDVGCGQGLLVEALRRKGLESHCLERDNSEAQVMKNNWPEEYIDTHYRIYNLDDEKSILDIEIKKTDVVTSFEVADRIRPEKASHFIHLLTFHSPKLIMFGAATIDQGRGMNNPQIVNANTYEYWIDKFHEEGYVVDWYKTIETRIQLLSNPDIQATWWFPKNILLFRPITEASALASLWRSNPEPINLRDENLAGIGGGGEFGMLWRKDWNDFARLFYEAKGRVWAEVGEEAEITPTGQSGTIDMQQKQLSSSSPPPNSHLWHELRMTPLHAAAFAGELTSVQELLKQFPDAINVRNRNGATPLMLASQADRVEVVEYLLQSGADPIARDSQDATPLRAAVLLGRVGVVKSLLRHDAIAASILMAEAEMVSLVDMARDRDYDEIADFLDDAAVEAGVDPKEALERYQRHLSATNELPDGAVLTSCDQPVRVREARCDLVECRGLRTGRAMPTVDAMTMMGDGGVPCPFRPLGDLIKTIVRLQVEEEHGGTFLFTSKPQLRSVDHLPVEQRELCPQGHPACTLNVNWASGCDQYNDAKEGDIWPCLFGKGEATFQKITNDERGCDCGDDSESQYTRRDVKALLHSAILLDGNRTSRFMEPGPTLPPYSETNGGIAVSVHIRGGDACDAVTWSANTSTWALWPFDWNGIKAGTDWNRVTRFCIHPSVHLAVLRGIVSSHNVSTVLLATDSAEAVELFQQAVPTLIGPGGGTIELKLNGYDRTSFATNHHSNKEQVDHWIEIRAQRNEDFAAHAMHSALEDVRLLARGSILIASMCSNFAKMVYTAMLGHNEMDVPVVSVDACEVVCDAKDLKFTEGAVG